MNERVTTGAVQTTLGAETSALPGAGYVGTRGSEESGVSSRAALGRGLGGPEDPGEPPARCGGGERRVGVAR